MNVRIDLIHPCAKVPKYHSAWAAGADLHSVEDVTLEPWGRATVPTGVVFEIPAGYEAQVRGRSGLFRNHGVHAILGTIDADYRGEVCVMLVNLSPHERTLKAGERIAQLVIAPVARASFHVITDGELLHSTERGAGGFGSTGTK